MFSLPRSTVVAMLLTLMAGFASLGLSEPSGGQRLGILRHPAPPWTVIIDRDGVVRFNGFSLDPQRGIQMVRALLGEKPSLNSSPIPARP